MIKKLSFICIIIAFSNILFAIGAPETEMASMQPTFKILQGKMNLETKTKFEQLCDKLMTPGMFMPEYFTEDNMKNEVMMMFNGQCPEMGEDASLFYLTYRLWEKHNGINVAGQTPKQPLGGTKTPSGPQGQVQLTSQPGNVTAFENNVIQLAGKYYQKVKMNTGGKIIRQNQM